MEELGSMPERNYEKKITNSKHVRQILSRTLNQLMNAEIEPKFANSIATLCNTMLKVLRATNLEERINRLEEIQGSKEPKSSPVTSDIKQMIKEMRS